MIFCIHPPTLFITQLTRRCLIFKFADLCSYSSVTAVLTCRTCNTTFSIKLAAGLKTFECLNIMDSNEVVVEACTQLHRM